MGVRLDRTGTAVALQETDEEGEAHGEEVGDLPEGVVAAGDDGEDAFPEI
jgi:hypothetical protein